MLGRQFFVLKVKEGEEEEKKNLCSIVNEFEPCLFLEQVYGPVVAIFRCLETILYLEGVSLIGVDAV